VNHQCFDNRQAGASWDPDDEGLTVTDQLFALLDGQEIAGSRGAWRAEVVGIHEARGALWVQIGPALQPEQAVLVRMPSNQPLDSVLDALRDWSAVPEERRASLIDLG
jgi:hypothetical protein